MIFVTAKLLYLNNICQKSNPWLLATEYFSAKVWVYLYTVVQYFWQTQKLSLCIHKSRCKLGRLQSTYIITNQINWFLLTCEQKLIQSV